jgi:hypothetical protein
MGKNYTNRDEQLQNFVTKKLWPLLNLFGNPNFNDLPFLFQISNQANSGTS